ncbi:50S ribosomal protein L31 [Candidatus Uhrbacteria bacterium]|nr:50S ribosomal protein L31 [Candidatus Uhrbacteria bacterium]
MKSDVHPKYHTNAVIVCSCGNRLEVGSTIPEIHIEVCAKCHPYYTGTQRILDTARRVDKYQKRMTQKAEVASTRKGKRAKQAARTLKRKEAAKEKETAEPKIEQPQN